MTLSLEALGFTQEELQQRVVSQLCESLTKHISVDEDGDPHTYQSELARKLNDAVCKRVDEAIAKIAAEHILPNVATYIENFCLQATNQWGEKRGEKLTFVEYLTQRAHAYITEQVNYEGKSKGEDSYSWRGTQTRIAHMINKHLHYSIETAMSGALKDANSHIVKGLEETVKLKLKEVSDGLSVALKIK